MLYFAQSEVSLHRGTERVDVAVGVPAGENIFATGQRIEPGGVVEILDRQVTVAISRAALVGKK